MKLTGSVNSGNRRMEINLAERRGRQHELRGARLRREQVFAQVIDTINRTIPDHLAGTPIVVPQ